jgi:hypothetical protein
MTTTAFKLAKYCIDDTIPDCSQVCEDYGFAKCKTEHHYSYLLGMYQRLVRMPGFNTHDMHVARIQGTLFQYIQELYDKNDPQNFYYRMLIPYKSLFTS